MDGTCHRVARWCPAVIHPSQPSVAPSPHHDGAYLAGQPLWCVRFGGDCGRRTFLSPDNMSNQVALPSSRCLPRGFLPQERSVLGMCRADREAAARVPRAASVHLPSFSSHGACRPRMLSLGVHAWVWAVLVAGGVAPLGRCRATAANELVLEGGRNCVWGRRRRGRRCPWGGGRHSGMP
jgi:hypothetical protein